MVRAVPARDAAEVAVPVPTNTNAWRFNVRLDELGSVPNWEFRIRLALAGIGIRIRQGRTYELLTPTLPELTIETAPPASEPPLLPLKFRSLHGQSVRIL